MLVAERRSISRIVFVRHPSTSIHRVRYRMYSTKHWQSSKRSSRDSDFTNQHQPSLSVTPMLPQQGSHTYQRRLPFDGNPSLRRRRPGKRVSQPSQSSSTARMTGSASGKSSRSAKSNRGTASGFHPSASHSSTRASADVQLNQSRLRHDKQTSSIIVHYPDGPSTHLRTILSFLYGTRLEKSVASVTSLLDGKDDQIMKTF